MHDNCMMYMKLQDYEPFLNICLLSYFLNQTQLICLFFCCCWFFLFFFLGGGRFLKIFQCLKTVIKDVFIFHVRVYPPVQLIEYECERRVHEFYIIKS